ncbi:MAG: PEP-CTERM sorting domain-containing protein, partial [Pirellula sp.]
VITFDMTNWEAYDFIDAADPRNTQRSANIGAGSQVTAIRWINMRFESFLNSVQSELTFGVNKSNPADQNDFWDFVPAAGINTNGVYGPQSGNFGPGILGSGPFAVRADGLVFVELYTENNLNLGTSGTAGLEARVTSGTLEITFTAVPEPGTLALMSIAGVLACTMSVRRFASRSRLRIGS